jgi:DtxR family Mn-dependent transcriptional regulator
MNQSVEEYLEAIYSFNERGELAKNQDIAERLGVSPPSVTEMIKKLADEGLVIHESYKGVLLTGKGMAEAQKVARKHRLLERFLHDGLGLANDKVHSEACKMEHALGDEAAAALCESLNNPKTCPDDGKAIPECTVNVADCSQCKTARELDDAYKRTLTQLDNLRPGECGRVAFTRCGGNASQRIMDMGLCRGTEVRVVKSAPFDGPVEVQVRGTLLAIGRRLAEKIFIEVERCRPEAGEIRAQAAVK